MFTCVWVCLGAFFLEVWQSLNLDAAPTLQYVCKYTLFVFLFSVLVNFVFVFLFCLCLPPTLLRLYTIYKYNFIQLQVWFIIEYFLQVFFFSRVLSFLILSVFSCFCFVFAIWLMVAALKFSLAMRPLLTRGYQKDTSRCVEKSPVLDQLSTLFFF